VVIKDESGQLYVEIEVHVEHETDDAVLFDDETWVPKVCMEDWPDIGQSGTAIIKENFAIKKGLI